jgi:hypothetical protein
MEHITLRFAIDPPRMSRHRVSVWSDEGALLRSPSSEVPENLEVADGETIWVEASVPGTPTRNTRPERDERRWELRADPDARAVLNIGRKGKNGASGTHLAITVDGARQSNGAKRQA